jgi:metal-responsive CopG/Arc/MetJ family transcriptional regulator
MANIKTAVSLQESLFKQVDALARKLNVTRSRLFALALENFVRHHENQQLLDKINQAYQDGPDPSEQKLLREMRRNQRKLLEGQW